MLLRINGYIESFNDRLGVECLNCEIFYSLKEAKGLMGSGAFTTTPNVRTQQSFRPPAAVTIAPPPNPLDEGHTFNNLLTSSLEKAGQVRASVA